MSTHRRAHALGLGLFGAGFFLTRRELPHTSACDPTAMLAAVGAEGLLAHAPSGAGAQYALNAM